MVDSIVSAVTWSLVPGAVSPSSPPTLALLCRSADPFSPPDDLAARSAGFRGQRSRDHVVTGPELAGDDGRDFSVGVVGDTEGDLDRHDRVAGPEFPHDGAVALRARRRISGGVTARTPFRRNRGLGRGIDTHPARSRAATF